MKFKKMTIKDGNKCGNCGEKIQTMNFKFENDPYNGGQVFFVCECGAISRSEDYGFQGGSIEDAKNRIMSYVITKERKN